VTGGNSEEGPVDVVVLARSPEDSSRNLMVVHIGTSGWSYSHWEPELNLTAATGLDD
jgi:hypothetical protein